MDVPKMKEWAKQEYPEIGGYSGVKACHK